jgi:glycosyltransferase involved in cell wall biosynthesis
MEPKLASSSVPTNASQTRPCDGFLSSTLVLIPALDEAGNVGHVVREWLALGVGRIRVVDNGSRDATAHEAAEAGAEVLHERQRGYGAACQRGLANLPGSIRWLMFSSADGSDVLRGEDLPDWNRAVEDGAVLVVGDRTRWVESRRNLKCVQRLGNTLASFLLGIGWGHRPRDLGSLRLISVEALHRLHLRDRTFGWNVEMHARCAELGLRVVELPVLYRLRRSGASKISGNLVGTWRAGRTILATLGKLWWQRLTHRRRNVASDVLAGATTTPKPYP